MRKTIGPFSQLQTLKDVIVDPSDGVEALDVMDQINAALATAGCNCNGHALGDQRDHYWGADLSELVCRAATHQVTSRGSDGRDTSTDVRVRLETLRVDVDANNEVCAWIYEEH